MVEEQVWGGAPLSAFGFRIRKYFLAMHEKQRTRIYKMAVGGALGDEGKDEKPTKKRVAHEALKENTARIIYFH